MLVIVAQAGTFLATGFRSSLVCVSVAGAKRPIRFHSCHPMAIAGFWLLDCGWLIGRAVSSQVAPLRRPSPGPGRPFFHRHEPPKIGFLKLLCQISEWEPVRQSISQHGPHRTHSLSTKTSVYPHDERIVEQTLLRLDVSIGGPPQRLEETNQPKFYIKQQASRFIILIS